MGLIHAGQQLDIGPGIALGKAVPLIDQARDLALLLVASDQTRHLGPAQAGDLGDIAAQQAARPSALLLVLLMAQHSLHPDVHLLWFLTRKVHAFAGC